MSTRQRG